MKSGNEVLAEIQKEMSLDDVEKLMQDTADAIAYQNEISELLGSKLDESDEQDLLDELDKLAAVDVEELKEKLPSVPVQSLPILEEADVQDEAESQFEEESENEREREMIPA